MRARSASALRSVAIAWAIGGCASATRLPPAKTGPHAPASAVPSDAALALAALLPAGAERCIVARPAAAPPEQRALLARVMQSPLLVWSDELAISALAIADYGVLSGGGAADIAHVTLLRSTLPPDALRAQLDARLRIDWSGHACIAEPCPARGEVLPDGAVRLVSGAWPKAPSPGVEPRCQSASAEEREAIELQAFAARGPLGDRADDGIATPVKVLTLAYAEREGVRIERSEHMAGRDDAALRATQLRAERQPIASEVEIEQADAVVRVRTRILWEDLELSARDDARVLAAERAARARIEMTPPALEPGLAPSEYLARAAHLLLGMNDLSGTERTAQRAALRALLEQAVAEHPEHEPLGFLLFELRRTDPEGGQAAAVQLAERFAALPGADPRWKELAKPRDEKPPASSYKPAP